MNEQILFFFSALGVFNGLLLAFYFLIFAKPRHISNVFLGISFLVLSIRVGKSVFFFFNPSLAGSFIQIGITACFFIGPFLYFYIKSVLRPHSKVHYTWKYHIAVLLPLILYLGIKYPYLDHHHLWTNYFMNFIFLQWAIYLILTGIVLFPVIKKIGSQEKLSSIEIWLLNIFFGNTVIWLAYLTSNYTSYIVGAISFSFIIYILILFLVFSRKKRTVLFKNGTRYNDRKIQDRDARQLKDKLDHLLTNEKLYTNTDLKISYISSELQISVHELSQLINDNMGTNFPSLINKHRVAAAKKMILQNNNLTLEAIGNECGFKSKSAFYTAFKKYTGTTPARYKHEISTTL